MDPNNSWKCRHYHICPNHVHEHNQLLDGLSCKIISHCWRIKLQDCILELLILEIAYVEHERALIVMPPGLNMHCCTNWKCTGTPWCLGFTVLQCCANTLVQSCKTQWHLWSKNSFNSDLKARIQLKFPGGGGG